LCIQEILARTLKTLFRDAFSVVNDRFDEHLPTVVLRYMNDVFGDCKAESSQTLWRIIMDLSDRKFGFAVTSDTLAKMHKLAVARVVLSKIGVAFTEEASTQKEFEFVDSPMPFTITDFDPVSLSSFIVRSKTNFVPQTEAERLVRRLLEEASALDARGMRSQWNLPGGPEREKASGIYRDAARVCRERVNDVDTALQQELYFTIACHFESRHAEKGRPENSRWNRCAYVPRDALSDEAWHYYTKCLELKTSLFRRAQCLLGLARLSKKRLPDPMRVREMSDDELFETYEPARLLNRCAQLAEKELGFQHPRVAEMYTYQALLYAEMNDPERASPWIRRAFVIVHGIFGADHEECIGMMNMLRSIEMKCDDGLERIADPFYLVKRIEELELVDEDDAAHGAFDEMDAYDNALEHKMSSRNSFQRAALQRLERPAIGYAPR
jgi:hypothetical protein